MSDFVVFPDATMRTAFKAVVELTMIDTCVIVSRGEGSSGGWPTPGGTQIYPAPGGDGKCRIYAPPAEPTVIVAGQQAQSKVNTYLFLPAGVNVTAGAIATVTSGRTGVVTEYRVSDDLDKSEEFQHRVRVEKVGQT